MNIQSFLVLGLPILTGTLIVHLLWVGKNNPVELTLKLSLGIGLGFGISSLLYFVYLIFLAGKPYFLYVELAILFAVVAAVFLKHKKTTPVPAQGLRVNFLQLALLVVGGIVSILSFIGIVNYSVQRAHGDWDAWMIYNRSARFIYLGQENWRDAFSKDMYVLFHADYPPLLALNIASRWDILGEETTYVPMFQGFLFSLASLGVCFGTLASLKSLGQGGLGLIFLSGVSFFLYEGGRQQADVPLAFYILVSIAFLFFYFREKRPVLIIFAGFAAGLAAWTKNEGILFLCVSTGIMFIAAFWKRSFQELIFYFTGLLLPLILLLYFKLQLTRPNEFLSGENTKIAQYLFDISRHRTILNSFKNILLHNGGWYNIGIFLVLLVYFVLFHSKIKDNLNMLSISLAIFACQLMGYYVIYLITPNDVIWQLNYSLNRLFVQIYPAIVLVVLITSQSPETIFSSEPE